MELLRVLLVLPPARISHGPDTFGAMPACELTVVGDMEHAVADKSIVLPARRAGAAGDPKYWTASLAWLGGMAHIEPGPIDVVASLELFSVASLQALRLARRLGVPHVVRVTENLADKPPYVLPPWRQITAQTVRHSDGFLCVTEGAQAVALEKGCPSERTVVVHHGINVETFSPRLAGLPAEPIVTFVGELRPQKGIMDLVAAFDGVVADQPDARLRVIGDGTLRPDLEALATSRKWLWLGGRRVRADIPDVLRESRVLAVPSRSARKFRGRWVEQFGFSLVEGMACGLPVVTTRCGAIPEIVPPWNPIVTEGDIGALRSGILQVLGADADDVGRRNRSFAVDQYDIRRQGARMRSAIEQLLERGPRRGRD